MSKGTLPKRLVFGLTSGAAFNGDITKNCYNFEHFSLASVSIKVNNVEIPHSPVEMDFKRDLYNKAYYTLFNGLDRGALDNGNHISREEFAQGYSLFAFDLTPDKSNGCSYNLTQTGNLRIELTFNETLEKAIYCIVYTESDNIIEITKERQIIFNQVL